MTGAPTVLLARETTDGEPAGGVPSPGRAGGRYILRPLPAAGPGSTQPGVATGGRQAAGGPPPDGRSTMTFAHQPVLRDEVVSLFAAVPAGWLVDGTAGAGGHTAAILEARPDLHGLAIDRDPAAREAARRRLEPFGDRARVVPGVAADLGRHAGDLPVVGILLDLGVSSPQIDDPERGFSYRADGPLDMRMDPEQGETAAELLDRLDVDELTRLLRELGDEPHARRVARAILASRPVRTTGELGAVVRAAVPAGGRRGDPAKRTFQALRMAVNAELDQLAQALAATRRTLVPGGRVAVIAYHSGEDRLVKQWLRDVADPGRHQPRGLPVPAPVAEFRILTRRPIRPSAAEVSANPRAASARLRAAERLRRPDVPGSLR